MRGATDSAILFIPAGDERKLAKIGELPACSIVFDCEDAVAIERKTAAREALAASLALAREADREALVRINALTSDWGHADARAAVKGGALMLLVPKADDPALLAQLDTTLGEAERAAGVAAGAVRLIALIETARGAVAMREILSAPRVDAATLGLADLAVDLGTAWHDAMLQSPALFLAERTQLALHSRALRRQPPWDPVYLAVDDQPGYLADVMLGKRLGSQGKFVIHPKQIAAVAAAYAISSEELARARAIVEVYGRAVADGRGAVTFEGMLVDEPVVVHARMQLARSARA